MTLLLLAHALLLPFDKQLSERRLAVVSTVVRMVRLRKQVEKDCVLCSVLCHFGWWRLMICIPLPADDD